MQRDFFKRIWGEQTGWAIIGRIHQQNKENVYNQRAYRYPDHLDVLLEDLKSWNVWASVYFYPLITPEGKRDKEHIRRVPLLWIDKDKGAPEDLKPRPSLCWQTSSGKCQALWILTEPVGPKDAEQVNRYLTYKLGGDPGSRDLMHMLRVPGSLNHKYDPVEEGIVLWDNGPTYSIDDLMPEGASIEALKEEAVRDIKHPEVPEDLPPYHEVITRWGASIPNAVWDLLNQRPDRDEADWSRQLWKIEHLLLDAKIPVEDVFVIVRESTWNKYAADGRPDDELWREVWKAFYEDTRATHDTETRFNWMSFADLLKYEKEPEWMIEDIWMDEMVGWIAGVGKSFKSVISLDLALSIASGEPFLDTFQVLKPGPVIIVQEEDPAHRVAYRTRGIASHKGLTDVKVKGSKYLIPNRTDVPLVVSTGAGFTFNDKNFIEDLEMMLLEWKPKMLILDPWFMMTGGIDEFKSGEVTEVLRLLKLWREKYGCAICVVHHYRKGKGDPHELLYGSHAFYGWSENNMFVSRDKTSNAVKIMRDIKDADQTTIKPLTLNFTSIGNKYDFSLTDKDTGEMLNPVVSYLRTLEIGTTISKDDLAEAVGLNEKTVRDKIKTLHEEDRVLQKRIGRGGKIGVQTLPALYLTEGVDMDVDPEQADKTL